MKPVRELSVHRETLSERRFCLTERSMRHEYSLDALNFFLADVRQGLWHAGNARPRCGRAKRYR